MDKRFKGVLFSATVNHGVDHSASRQSTGTLSAENVSYNELKRIIEEMGGKVCATVHKKVDYVIASSDAVNGATQRVRKADKFKIPVLKIEFIFDVYNNKALPNAVSSYVYSTETIDEKIDAYRDSSSKVANIPGRETDVVNEGENTVNSKASKINEDKDLRKMNTKRKICQYKIPIFDSGKTFDCGCICHDRGESSCSWCVSAHNAPEAVNTTTATTATAAADTEPSSSCGNDCGDTASESLEKKKKNKKKNKKAKKNTDEQGAR